MPRPMIRDRRRRPGLEPLEGRALLASLMVTNTLDSGAGSLRQAITDADAASGSSTIGFAIPGTGVQTIGLATALPAISRPVTIDGTTQAGYAGSPLVAINGPSQTPVGGMIPSPSSGLVFLTGADGSVVEGLAIDRFGGSGIAVTGPRVTIENNSIGVDPSGLAAGNGTGIVVFGGADLPSGATNTPGTLITGNVIGGNSGDGVELLGPAGVTVSGNFIGTDAAGKAVLGNSNDGLLATSGTTGSTASNNVIANNARLGIDDLSGGGLTLANNTLTNNGALVANLAVVATTPSGTAGGVSALTGQSLTTTYTVTNNGPNTANGVTLGVGSLFSRQNVGTTYRPSPVFTITGATTSQGTVGFTSPLAPGTEVAALGTLAPGASATVTVTYRIAGSGQDNIEAFASSSAPTTVAPGPSASTSINAIGNADIAVASSAAPIPALVGQPETFTFTVTNHDPNYSTDALFALQFLVSAGSTPIGALVSQGTVMALPAFPSGFGGDLGRLAPGASAVVTAVIIPPSYGVVSADLYAYSAANVDPSPANNLAYAAILTSSRPTILSPGTDPQTGSITSILVPIDGPINIAQAQDVRNYALTTAGSTARIKIQSASYETPHLPGPIPEVVLRLARPRPRTGAPLRLVVAGPGSPGLTGTDGSKPINAGVTLNVN